MRRRPLVGALLALGALPLAAQAAAVQRGRALQFPRDHGSHPDARTEWWYATGWLAAPGPAEASEPRYGFQLTFFRSRTDIAVNHPSRFAATQLVFAHTALTDLAAKRLRHDQRIARAGFGVAEAAEDDTRLVLRGWRLARSGPPEAGVYRASIASDAAGFALELELAATQPLLLQGEAGFSRKGPRPEQASHYLSEPQLAVHGTLTRDGRALALQGRAWLDHEWSEVILDAEAVGWDWIGINLADGSALTAFRLRRADGSALWAGGSLRRPGEAARAFGPEEVHFEPLARWTSPASRATYPIEWRVSTPAGRQRVRALLHDQELDSRASTGAIYWEGLSELLAEDGRRLGLGYLEMTGYATRLKL
ncbi:lipocalin-like domain-containing protein [Piscinibacter sp.]|uniref:lipocalin-like domain-containing protein n=1 Tax=Piscinibacter sp. TaxID=1903157 RepID=UPI0035AE0E5A